MRDRQHLPRRAVVSDEELGLSEGREAAPSRTRARQAVGLRQAGQLPKRTPLHASGPFFFTQLLLVLLPLADDSATSTSYKKKKCEQPRITEQKGTLSALHGMVPGRDKHGVRDQTACYHHSHREALTPTVTVLTDSGCKEVIKVKQGPRVGL